MVSAASLEGSVAWCFGQEAAITGVTRPRVTLDAVTLQNLRVSLPPPPPHPSPFQPPTTTMAKSTRSKVKRSFRRDKREVAGSAYAAVDAARLERLSAKLRAKFATKPVDGENDDEVEMQGEDGAPAGWLDFALFGLLDPDQIGFAALPCQWPAQK